MARNAILDKYVNGDRYSQGKFRRLVVDTVRKINDLYPDREGARARHVAETWGDPSWLEPDNLAVIAQTLVNLRVQKHLVSPARGAYRVNPVGADLGLDVTEQYERTLHKIMIEQGGFAQTKTLIAEAKRAVADAPAYVEKVVTRVLAQSDLFLPHYKGTVWALRNLPADELAHLPLLGRWVKLRLLHAYRMIMSAKRLRDVDDMAEAEAHRHFKRVGSTFRHVLDMTGADLVEEMADLPALRDALLLMIERHPHARTLRHKITEAYEEWGDTFADLKAKGWTIEKINRRRDDEVEDLIYTMFDWFCDGEADAHQGAPLSFYTTFADFAGLDAAQLSRGVMEWNLKSTSWMASRNERAAPVWEAFPEYADLDGSAEPPEEDEPQ